MQKHKYELIIFGARKMDVALLKLPNSPDAWPMAYEEAIKNTEVVISEWIKTARSLGREIPEPKGRLAYA